MSYLFQPEALHEIARKAVGMPYKEMFTKVTNDLEMLVPGRIRHKQRWLFNTACGATGQMTLLYGSLSEYIILFGTPIGTEGFSGRYFADVHDFMLDGEMWTYHDGDFERSVYKPGDWARLDRGRAKGYCVKDHAWMLEYARGWIPLMLPIGLADNFFSNLDFRSVCQLFWDYGGLCISELMRGKI